MVMTNPIILYWICSTSVCNHPVGAPTKPDFFFNMSVHDCVGKNNTTLLQYYLFSTHAKTYQKHPVKKNTPYRTGKKMVCCAVGKVNELVRTAHFERSKLLKKTIRVLQWSIFLVPAVDYAQILVVTCLVEKNPPQFVFLMRKMRIALFHYSHCPFLKYIIWPHNINYCCCFCCRFHAVLIFFPVRVVISVSLQPDIVVSLLFLLLFFLCLFS